MIIKVTIEGISPLIMQKFSEDDLKPNKRQDKNITMKEIAEKYAYRLENRDLYIPGINIFSCLVAAGHFHKIKKSKLTTMKSSLIPAGLDVIEEVCSLNTQDYEIDSRSAVIPSNGARVMVYRPILKDWSTTFTLEIDHMMFDESLIKNLVEDAGIKCGLGSMRPNKKGKFGKFKIKEWHVR